MFWKTEGRRMYSYSGVLKWKDYRLEKISFLTAGRSDSLDGTKDEVFKWTHYMYIYFSIGKFDIFFTVFFLWLILKNAITVHSIRNISLVVAA